MADELFPKEFIERVKRDLPEAERLLVLAERRIQVAKAIGADTAEQERQVFTLRQNIRRARAALKIG